MPRLHRTPDKLVFLVNIAAPGKVLLVPLLGATAVLAFVLFGIVRSLLVGGSSQSVAPLLPGAALVTSLVLVVVLTLDLVLLGSIYVFDRPSDRITAYRGPLPVHRHVLSELLDVDVSVSTDREGVEVALGSLLFRSGGPFQLNTIPTGSTDELLDFQREVRHFLPPSAERAAREQVERQPGVEAKALIEGVAPQLLSAVWKSKGVAAITHPREAMTFLAQYLEEHAGDPEFRDLMKALQGLREDPAAATKTLQDVAQRLRERGDLKGADRIEEAAARLWR